ncbi:RNA helicase [Tenacibaculum maritimum]
MPISSIDGCTAEHWSEVLGIIQESLNGSDFEAKLVSESDDVGIIHKRIVQNIYNSDIVVCDVSAKNANVMFELGLRLAFDKPTIIIKDDKTDYSFDTSLIEHLQYPRDLRFTQIVKFKEELKKKLIATHTKATTDKNYTTFLKHFGNYKIAKLDETEISSQDYLINAVDELKSEMRSLRNLNRHSIPRRRKSLDNYDNQRIAEIELIIKKNLEEYLTENPIRNQKELLIVRDELEEYLESKPEVRKICGSGHIFREAIDKFIYN